MKRLFVLFIGLAFFYPFLAFGASSIDVSQNDITYHYLDQLIAHDLVHSAIIGQRPYSREEVARLTAEALRNWEKRKEGVTEEEMDLKEHRRWMNTSKRINQILKYLKRKYRNELMRLNALAEKDDTKSPWIEFHGMENINFLFTFLDSNPTTFRVNNGGGRIDAISNPLVQNRQGRDYVDGAQYSIETEHWLNLTRYSSFYFRPRFQMQFPSGINANDNVRALVQELYGVFNIHNFEIQIGRSSLIEGQGFHGGLFISDHARPLDHIQVSNDHPIVLPWIFKYLGHNKFMAFYANLGPESFFPYTHFAGYKWSLKPFKIWEIGISNMLVTGGDGAPSFGAWDFLGDFIGFAGTGQGKSNRILGFDTRVTLPFLRNTQFYLEFFLDDKTTASLKRTFIDTAAYFVGIYIPRLNHSGTLQARVEFRYISEIFYRHGQFQSGYTLNREIIGDPLGPDGRSVMASIGWDLNPNTFVDLQFNYEVSDSNFYNNSGDSITVLINSPAEKRLRWVWGVRHRFKNRLSFLGKFGYERVNNFNYVNGDSRNHFLAEAGITIELGDHFTYSH